MEQKKDLTRLLIAESFKELMLEHPFKKITIKMITDRAGIIRPTFYYHFQDKYELMEWILEEDVIQKLNILLEQGMEREAIKMLFICLNTDKQYYRRAMEVTGQNGFEEIMNKKIEALFLREIKTRPVKLPKGKILDKEAIIRYYCIGLFTYIKIWLKDNSQETTVEDIVDTFEYLVSHTIFDVLKK